MKAKNKFDSIPAEVSDIQERAPDKVHAFHGSKVVRDFYLGRLRAHMAADDLVRGQYWNEGRGCAVGCTIHGSNHRAYEKELGIPIILARLEDTIFEHIKYADALAWPERFLTAPSLGADLSLVWPRFAVWLLIDEKDGMIQFARDDRSIRSINAVAELWTQVIGGKSVNSLKQRFRAIAWEGNDVAAYTADAADNPDAAAFAADTAYDIACESRNDRSIGHLFVHWQKMADKLIELMAMA